MVLRSKSLSHYAQDLLRRWNSQDSPRLQLQWKEDIVVVANHPPQIRVAEVAIGDEVDAVAFDHGVEDVVGLGRGIDAGPRPQELPKVNAKA